MPDIAEFHPQMVHFVVALPLVGVGMRVVSPTRLLPFTGAREATMAADIHLAMGHADSARARLTSAVTAFPQNTRLKAKLDSIK